MKPAVLLALLPSLSLSKDIQLRIPQTCRTTSGDSCIFPFTFKGQTFTKCTYTNSPTPWCATMVDQIGNVITNRWGDCDTAGRLSSCETDSRSSSVSSCITKGGPTPNRPCVFPFKHNGRTYSTCTNVSIGKFWCSTATKSDGTHIVAVEHQNFPIETLVHVEYVRPLCLNGKTQGLLGVGPPFVMHEDVEEDLESVSQEESLPAVSQSPHLFVITFPI